MFDRGLNPSLIRFDLDFWEWVVEIDWYSYWYAMYSVMLAMVCAIILSFVGLYGSVNVSLSSLVDESP